MKRYLKQSMSGIGIPQLFFLVFLIMSHTGRWDFIYASAEVDLRSWLSDHLPPSWSYQLCGGMTRMGDPASWGLSPWFLLVLLFGPVWGTKSIVFLLVLVGFYYLKKILTLFFLAGNPRKALTKRHHQLLSLLSLMFVFGNGFLWRFHRGQIAFASLYLAMPIIFYTLRGMGLFLGWKDFLFATFFTWCFYSGPFPTGTLFLLTPFFISVTLWVGLQWLQDPGHHLRQLAEAVFRMGAFHVVGLGLAFYRVSAVYRELGALPSPFPTLRENGNPFKSLVHQLLPTFGENYLGLFKIDDPGGVIGYSAFTLLPLWIVAYVLLHIYRRDKNEFHESERAEDDLATNHLGSFLWIFGITIFLCLLGDRAGFLPHRLVNQLLFNHTVQGIGGYQITLTFLLALLVVHWLRREVDFQLFARKYLYWPTLVIICLGFLTFEKPKNALAQFAEVAKIQTTRSGPVRAFLVPKAVDRYPIYRTVASGMGVMGCRSVTMLNPTSAQSPQRDVSDVAGAPSFLVSTAESKMPMDCLEKSYYTQNSLRIHESCPKDICVNIAAASPKERAQWQFNPKLLRYCR